LWGRIAYVFDVYTPNAPIVGERPMIPFEWIDGRLCLRRSPSQAVVLIAII